MLPQRTTLAVCMGRVRHTHQQLCSLTRVGRYQHADRFRSDLHTRWSVPRHHLWNVSLPTPSQRVRTIYTYILAHTCDKYSHNYKEAAFLCLLKQTEESRIFL